MAKVMKKLKKVHQGKEWMSVCKRTQAWAERVMIYEYKCPNVPLYWLLSNIWIATVCVCVWLTLTAYTYCSLCLIQLSSLGSCFKVSPSLADWVINWLCLCDEALIRDDTCKRNFALLSLSLSLSLNFISVFLLFAWYKWSLNHANKNFT